MSGTNEIHSSIDRSKRRDVWHRNWNRSLFAFLPYILFTESTHYELLSMPICLHFFFFLFYCGMYAMFNRYLLSFCTLACMQQIPRYTMLETFIRFVGKNLPLFSIKKLQYWSMIYGNNNWIFFMEEKRIRIFVWGYIFLRTVYRV